MQRGASCKRALGPAKTPLGETKGGGKNEQSVEGRPRPKKKGRHGRVGGKNGAVTRMGQKRSKRSISFKGGDRAREKA